MDKAISWLRDRRQEVVLIWRELLPQIFHGVISAIITWWGLYVFGLLSIITSMLITLKEEGFVDIDMFLYPNFVEGIGWLTALIFLYQIAATLAKRLNFLRTHAGKYTWDDVEIDEYVFPRESVHDYAIKISNKKPFVLEKVKAEIVHIQENKEPQGLSRNVPHNIPWIIHRKYIWGLTEIKEHEHTDNSRKDDEAYVALFNTIEEEDIFTYYIPVWESEPKSRRTFWSPQDVNHNVIVEIQVSCEIEGRALKPRTIMFSVERNHFTSLSIKKIGDTK